jgi:hypothetical protein
MANMCLWLIGVPVVWEKKELKNNRVKLSQKTKENLGNLLLSKKPQCFEELVKQWKTIRADFGAVKVPVLPHKAWAFPIVAII